MSESIALKKSSSWLIEAVRKGDEAKVRELLEIGVNPNARDNTDEGNGVLYYAVHGTNLSILEMLLEQGSYSNDVNYAKVSIVETALKLSKYEFAETLLRFGARIKIKLFQDYYAAPVDSERRKLTLLFYRYADLIERNSNGLSILHLCSVYQDTEGISILLERGANIEQRTSGLGLTPLHMAAKALSVPCVSMLLKFGADLETQDEYGYTPLHHAVAHCQPGDLDKRLELMELLLEAGCQVNKRTNSNVTPLHIAARFGAYECMKLLLKYGADPNVRDHLGRTPMFSLISAGCVDERRLEAVQMMISAGADVSLPDNDGLSPRHLLSVCAFD